MSVRVAAATHVGHVRQRNEDHAVVGDVVLGGDQSEHVGALDLPGLVAVMDGMGGHPAGDVASRIVAEALADLAPAQVGDEDGVATTIGQLDQRLGTHMAEHPETRAMGTTIVGATVQADHRALAFAVGDSLGLWWADDELQLLFPPDRGRWGGITQVLGGSDPAEGAESLSPHVAEVDGPGRLLLSSDGLTDMLGPDELATAVAVEDVDKALGDLVNRALEAGGVDNVTVVLVDLAAPGT